MHDPGGVGRCERIGHLCDDAGDLDHRHLTAREASLERFSVVVRHRDERLTGVVADLVDRRDVWMIERAGGTRLPEQPGRAFPASGRFRLEKLECHAPVEVRVLSQIHRAHPAGADAADDPVMGDGGADHCVTILLLDALHGALTGHVFRATCHGLPSALDEPSATLRRLTTGEPFLSIAACGGASHVASFSGSPPARRWPLRLDPSRETAGRSVPGRTSSSSSRTIWATAI